MLVLTRKLKEEIQIGDNITIRVLRVRGNSVRIGIDAPDDVRIMRRELCDGSTFDISDLQLPSPDVADELLKTASTHPQPSSRQDSKRNCHTEPRRSRQAGIHFDAKPPVEQLNETADARMVQMLASRRRRRNRFNMPTV
jgi:carbon storage regulator CsrA